MFKDYYKLLDIAQDASDIEVKIAFREQTKKWHPDRNQGIDTTFRMQEINEAYLILKDKDARVRYDIEYNKFKQHQEQKKQTESENKKWQKREQHSEREYEYQDYKIEDDILSKWIENARRQAADLAIQAIKDFKGVTGAAVNGCVRGTIQLIAWVVVINFIFILVRACNN